jgi:hypothetical protein
MGNDFTEGVGSTLGLLQVGLDVVIFNYSNMAAAQSLERYASPYWTYSANS